MIDWVKEIALVISSIYAFRKLRASVLKTEREAELLKLQIKKIKSELRYRRKHWRSDLTTMKGACPLLCGTLIITW